jgi:hypothetical protein
LPVKTCDLGATTDVHGEVGESSQDRHSRERKQEKEGTVKAVGTITPRDQPLVLRYRQMQYLRTGLLFKTCLNNVLHGCKVLIGINSAIGHLVR